jgi:hypothetical protein
MNPFVSAQYNSCILEVIGGPENYPACNGECITPGFIYSDSLSSRIIITGNITSSSMLASSSAFQHQYAGGIDTFIAVIDKYTGDLIYFTYLGGELNDLPLSLNAGRDSIVLISGTTKSRMFPIATQMPPVITNGESDGWWAEFNYLDFSLSVHVMGGDGRDDIADCRYIAKDKYVLVGTTEGGLGTTENAYRRNIKSAQGQTNSDIFVMQISSDTVSYCTYFGGQYSDAALSATAIGDSTVFIQLLTESYDLPTSPSAIQKVKASWFYSTAIAELTFDGRLLYCSYCSGSGTEYPVQKCIISGKNYVSITGSTESHDFPVTTNARQDSNSLKTRVSSYIIQYDTHLHDIIYSSYIAGDSTLIPFDLFASDTENVNILFFSLSKSIGDFHTGYSELFPQDRYLLAHYNFESDITTSSKLIKLPGFYNAIAGSYDGEFIYLAGLMSGRPNYCSIPSAKRDSTSGNNDLYVSKVTDSISSLAALEDTPDACSVQVFPNPILDDFCVLVNSSSTDDANIDILDERGNYITSLVSVTRNTNLSIFVFSFSKLRLSKGVYFIRQRGLRCNTVSKIIYR